MTYKGITAALAARDANRNGDDSHTSGTGRPVQVVRECTYLDFLKCQPLNFKGTEGVCQVKFATCTLQENALTWWNSHVKTTTPKAAHAMPWRTLKKMMTDKYCPRGEIKKLESEMWNLNVKGTDVVAYSQRFQELALMCDRMFLEETDKVERYVDGLPDTTHGSADNKRKSDDTTWNNHRQPNKRQNTGRAYAAGNGERKEYAGTLPLSPAATNNHRNPTCYECGNQGHYRSDCPELKNQDHGNQVRGIGAHGMVHALEGGETNQDLNDIEDDINA
nr:hypothetical protein [Tanacetum cinerariifolium]